jgi:hypothetical protein
MKQNLFFIFVAKTHSLAHLAAQNQQFAAARLPEIDLFVDWLTAINALKRSSEVLRGILRPSRTEREIKSERFFRIEWFLDTKPHGINQQSYMMENENEHWY